MSLAGQVDCQRIEMGLAWPLAIIGTPSAAAAAPPMNGRRLTPADLPLMKSIAYLLGCSYRASAPTSVRVTRTPTRLRTSDGAARGDSIPQVARSGNFLRSNAWIPGGGMAPGATLLCCSGEIARHRRAQRRVARRNLVGHCATNRGSRTP